MPKCKHCVTNREGAKFDQIRPKIATFWSLNTIAQYPDSSKILDGTLSELRRFDTAAVKWLWQNILGPKSKTLKIDFIAKMNLR